MILSKILKVKKNMKLAEDIGVEPIRVLPRPRFSKPDYYRSSNLPKTPTERWSGFRCCGFRLFE